MKKNIDFEDVIKGGYQIYENASTDEKELFDGLLNLVNKLNHANFGLQAKINNRMEELEKYKKYIGESKK